MAPSQTLPGEVRPVWTSDRGTMARDTALNRWPKIVQGMVNDIQESSYGVCDGEGPETERLGILDALRQLKKDIESNELLSPLQSMTGLDATDFNKRLASLGRCSWHSCPWLYGECYLYRRVQSIFTSSNHWKGYDVFKRDKESALTKSAAAVVELANRYLQLSPRDLGEAPAKKLFMEMTEIALWGNATDLSLLHDLSLEDMQKLQGNTAIDEGRRNIVANDLDAVWGHLRQKATLSDRRIDIILDNAGFELFADILYACYLHEAGLASKIVLHAKCFPWFVSDAVIADVESLLVHLESDSVFPVRQSLDTLTPQIRRMFDGGTLSVVAHPFWTSAASFHELPTAAADLFEDLRGSHLTIWKGDLNYRKLTKDGLWPHTTPFKVALGPLGSESAVRVLALRTNKSDTCVGVEKESKVQMLDKEAPGKAWVRNGKYAVMSFSDGQ